MTTRRNILKGGAGLAAILASGKAPAYLIKSMLAARNSIGMGSGGAKLPYDAEVEYLESTGTQYIDTGVVATKSMGFEIEQSMTSAASVVRHGVITNGSGVGDWLGYRRHHFNMYNGKVSYYLFQTEYILYDADTSRHVVKYDPVQECILVDGLVKASFSIPDFNLRYNYWLFRRNSNISAQQSFVNCRLYAFKQYTNDVMIRDYIPVRFTNELSQPEGALYDRISGGLYRNVGTGNFSYGADKAS